MSAGIKVTPMRTSRMRENFSLHAIYSVPGIGDDEQFNVALPFSIVNGVRIEDVSSRLRPDTFDLFKERMGIDAARRLQQVKYALVHRYKPDAVYNDQQEWVGEEMFAEKSSELVRNLAACLRLIRPMRESALLMQGAVRNDETFDVERFDHPLEFHEVPEVQKVFTLRNRDAEGLRVTAPEFLKAMGGNFWKFRMAVQFHELGHFQYTQWKARYILWASAIESIYTSHNPNHQGSLVAKERIKWFLGHDTCIYVPGEISDLLPKTTITIGEIIDRLYEVRNFVAHGDKVPDHYFSTPLRRGFNGPVNVLEVLVEAASFIIRASLLRILREGLLDHFADAGSAEAYFAAAGLTKSAIKHRLKGKGRS